MKTFTCGDVVPGCEAHWERGTDDEIMSEVTLHARDAHGLDPIPEPLEVAVRALIHSAS
jgi:predicted small metal-binding protein